MSQGRRKIREFSHPLALKGKRAKAMVLAIAVFTAFLGSQCGNKSVPDEFIGVWEATAPEYEECYFQVSKDFIIFENRKEPETYSKNAIVKFEKTRGKKGLWYTISHRSKEGLKYKFHFYYDASNGGVIRLKNRPQVEWRKHVG